MPEFIEEINTSEVPPFRRSDAQIIWVLTIPQEGLAGLLGAVAKRFLEGNWLRKKMSNYSMNQWLTVIGEPSANTSWNTERSLLREQPDAGTRPAHEGLRLSDPQD